MNEMRIVHQCMGIIDAFVEIQRPNPKRIFGVLAVICSACLLQVGACAAALAASPLRVGAAAVELQADDSMVSAGAGIGQNKPFVGQDGLLRAVASVIQGPPDDTRIAIVSLDILAIGREHLDEAARQIVARTGILFDHILISATHTHHVPLTVDILGRRQVPQFVEQVVKATVSAVLQANENLRKSSEATLRFRVGSEETVGENSRTELSDGTIAWMFDHKDELRATGPFDKDFPVLVFSESNSSPTAVLFGHSTHTVGTRNPGRRSPGFYGLAAQTFEQESGAVTVFLEGASGSTHLRHLNGLAVPQRYVEAERRVLNALRYTVDQAQPILVNRVASVRREVTVKVRDFDEKQEEQAVAAYCSKRCAAVWGREGAANVETVFRMMRAEFVRHRGEKRTTWLSVMQIGDVAVVGVPAELFTQLGLDIKRRSPFRYTIIAELANDWIGYVGNADAYRLGGYQLWMGEHSWTERGTGELLVDEAVSLLNELYMQR